ncbi:MAG: nucleotide exchange factor GrpE [Cytophagaceae bacterium]|nr:nucleotide exchange factor GrpE [Cytophagaceae bacterium]
MNHQEPEITPETAIESENDAFEAVEEHNETDKVQAELAELKDKYLRLYSDFENFRRRTAKEKIELIRNASEEVVQSLLPVLDDVERAQAIFAQIEDGKVEREGIELIFQKFQNTLNSTGLKPMEAKGEAFDADLHESIAQFPAPSTDLKGKIIDVVEKGYYLNDKVIRFAKVVVGA